MDGIFFIRRVYLKIIYFWCLYVKCRIVGFQAVVPMISGSDLKGMVVLLVGLVRLSVWVVGQINCEILAGAFNRESRKLTNTHLAALWPNIWCCSTPFLNVQLLTAIWQSHTCTCKKPKVLDQLAHIKLVFTLPDRGMDDDTFWQSYRPRHQAVTGVRGFVHHSGFHKSDRTTCQINA